MEVTGVYTTAHDASRLYQCSEAERIFDATPPIAATRWHLSIKFIVYRKAQMIFYNSIQYKFCNKFCNKVPPTGRNRWRGVEIPKTGLYALTGAESEVAW